MSIVESPAGSAGVWLAARLIASLFYRVQRTGPSIPGGAVLLVANHPNALLDPALVQTTAGRPVRFLAKSTLFRGHVLGPIIRRSGAIPVYRRIDAGVDPARNVEAFAAVEAVLARGEVVCVFPEGISHSTGRLEPLRTGAARMTLASLARGTRVTLIPIGLNFHRLVSFRSRATVAYGVPFDCADLAAAYREAPGDAVQALTERIGRHLRELLVEADPRTELRIIVRMERLYSAARGVARTPDATLVRRQLIANGMHHLKARDPDQLRALYDEVNEYDAQLAHFGLRDRDVDRRIDRGTAIRFAVREALLAVVLAPLALVGLLLFAVPYGVTSVLARQPASLEQRATWNALGGTVIYGAWILGVAVVAGLRSGVPVGVGVFCLLPAVAVASLFAVEREAAMVRIVSAFLALRQTPLVARARLARQRNNIARVLENVQRWIERTET